MKRDFFFGDTPNWRSSEFVRIHSSLSLDQRAEKLSELWLAGRELMIEGIKIREPHLTEDEARAKLKILLYQSYGKAA